MTLNVRQCVECKCIKNMVGNKIVCARCEERKRGSVRK